ncbi:hypothetical protein [Sicyoidochytrium minutum DNA virus]|nr:hypothetical protein [Sicyoidochytrium minutum DNA virus]
MLVILLSVPCLPERIQQCLRPQ